MQHACSSARARRVGLRAAVVLLMAAFLLQCLAFVRANGQMYDEAVTLASGYRILQGHRDDLNAEHPPLAKVIAALPVKLLEAARLQTGVTRGESSFGAGRRFLYEGGVPHERLLALGRAPMIVLALVLVALVGAWAHRLWGPRAGLLALLLIAFDPNIVAHGSLVGHDVPVTLFATASFFAIGEFFEARRIGWLVAAGACAGLALATKYSGIVVLGAVCAALVARAAHRGDVRGWWEPRVVAPSRARALLSAGGNVVLLIGVALMVLRAVPGWDGPAYLAGVRAQLAHQGGGHPAYFLGEVSRSGWPAYFPVALALKEPPLTLALLLASFALVRLGAPIGRAWAAAVVPLGIMLVALVLVRVDIGVRYALPFVPTMILLASRVATVQTGRGPSAALALALVHHVSAAVRVAPHDLAFFSDVVGGPARGQKYLSDSNLDWGQDIRGLGEWLARTERPKHLYLAYFGTAQPEAYGVSYVPAPNSCPHQAPWRGEDPPPPSSRRELLAVSVMNAQGVFFHGERPYAWLDRMRPVAVIGYSIAIYDITDDVDAHRSLARMYDRYGPHGLP